MSRNEIIDAYFEWLCGFIGVNRRVSFVSYQKLLMRLHDIEFIYVIPRDENRAEDGLSLRYRFAYDYTDVAAEDIERCLSGPPCTVLEMMIALTIRCEETIMDDTSYGNRTGQWFWGMITNLGLGSMTDDRFNSQYVDAVIERFLNRDYEPDGRGGLFRVRNCDYDLRDVEIWHQLCWYLDSIDSIT